MQKRQKQLNRNRCAFSTIELLIVMLIVGILAAIAIPQFNRSTRQYEVKLAAQQLATNLEFAASIARARSTTVSVEFLKLTNEAETNRYWLSNVVDPHHPDREFIVDLNEKQHDVQLNSATDLIEFDIYGMPSIDGTWKFNEGTTFERQVTIEKATGKVTVN